MKQLVTELPLNPFAQSNNPKEVMRELLKNSKPLSQDEAMRRMKEAVEAQKNNKG